MGPEVRDLIHLQGKVKSIAIMGGTFNPIHYGHLVTAEAARAEYQLDKVLFVPNRQPPHKKDYPVTAAKHRYHMTVLATITNPHFYVSRIELDRPAPSYTIDTLRSVREVFGPGVKVYFISGADAILDILTWKDVDEVMEMCYFIAATRPGYPLEELGRRLGYLKEKYAHKVYCVEVPALAISSTDIRERVAQNRPIKYLLPESVEYYIYKYKLYQDEGNSTEQLSK